MASVLWQRLDETLAAHDRAGTRKTFTPLVAPQGPQSAVQVAGGPKLPVTILSSNDYLALANHPRVVAAAQEALARYGAGTASVRFICGTMKIHDELETALAAFHHQPAALTFASAWMANTALFATLLQPGDVVFSDALNHASIIDGLRLLPSGVTKVVYPHNDMAALEKLLHEHRQVPVKMIVTDGVFSMEGSIVDLPTLVDIAARYQAVTVVDDCHGVGVLGASGRGVVEHFGAAVAGRVDIITGTLGKALGGGAGGYVAGPVAVIEMLKQAARPHLFSNAISPATAATSLAALQVLQEEPGRLTQLHSNVKHFRATLAQLGLRPGGGTTGIVPIILGETALAIEAAAKALTAGVMVTGFGYPVVPEGQARLRAQISAGHTTLQLTAAAQVLADVVRQIPAAGR